MTWPSGCPHLAPTRTKAIADAFRSGNLGLMDYYKMQNIQADTSMRESISGTPSTGSQGSKAKGGDSKGSK